MTRRHQFRKNSKNPHTLRRRAWYERTRELLIAQLGGQCVECGSRVFLQFDHIDGRDWEARAFHSCKRLSLYKREAALGMLQLLCISCNSRKGDPRAKVFTDSGEEVPF